MSIIKIVGHWYAVSPIHHGGDEKNGNVPVLRSVQQYVPEFDGFADMPHISGNSIRGMLRRRIVKHMLDTVGYELDETNKAHRKLHHALYTGGCLESSDADSGKADLEFRRQMRQLIPVLGLMGTSVGNQMLKGSLKCGIAFPRCSERGTGAHPARTMTGHSFATRLDDIKGGREEGEASQQMIVGFEVLNPGTVFDHTFILDYATELEASCLAHGVALWKDAPFVGGKSGSGYGEIVFAYTFNGITPQPYLNFLFEHGSDVISGIEMLLARIEGGGKKTKKGARGTPAEEDSSDD